MTKYERGYYWIKETGEKDLSIAEHLKGRWYVTGYDAPLCPGEHFEVVAYVKAFNPIDYLVKPDD